MGAPHLCVDESVDPTLAETQFALKPLQQLFVDSCHAKSGRYFLERSRCNATLTAFGVSPSRSAISVFANPTPDKSWIFSVCASPLMTKRAKSRVSRSSWADIDLDWLSSAGSLGFFRATTL